MGFDGDGGTAEGVAFFILLTPPTSTSACQGGGAQRTARYLLWFRFHQGKFAVEVRGDDLGGAEGSNGVDDANAELVFPFDGAGFGVEGKEEAILGPVEEDAVFLDEHGGIDVVAETGVEL